MPLPLEAGGVCRIVLDADKHKANPPTFLFPWLSARQHRRLMSRYEQADASVSGAPMDIGGLLGELSGLILGWENLPVAFDAGELDTVINVAEAFELLNKLLLQGPTGAEKNGFGSPSA